MLLLGVILLFAQSLSPEAIEHAQAGAAAERQGHFDVAIAEFQKEVDLQPELATGYANLGDAYFRSGKYEAAIPQLEHALRLNDNLRATHQILGVALLLQGDAAKALPHLEKAPIPQLLGVAYLQIGQASNAVYALQTALGGAANDPDVLYYYGHAAALASAQALQQAQKVGKGQTSAQESAPEPTAQTEQGQIPDLNVSLAALAKKPGDPDLLLEFGKEAALASTLAFDRLMTTNPASARAHQLTAERYTDQGKIPEAEKEYVESLRLAPATAGVHLALGKLLELWGDWPHAMEQFRAESALRPANADAFYYSGSALLDQGRAREALADLARADQLAPDTAQILMALGRAASQAGDFPRAEKAFTRVSEIDPSGKLSAEAHAALADNQKRKGAGKP
jgi:tetratricopeptide (TPR) repeat protein